MKSAKAIRLCWMCLSACGQTAALHHAIDEGSAVDGGVAPDSESDPSDVSAPDAASVDAGVAWGAADAGAPPPEEPALQVDESVLVGALRCPAVRRDDQAPVLLVHGTGANAEISWSWTYSPALSALGFDVCTVDLPKASWEDVALAAEYVVLALRSMRQRTNRQVVLIGHSQGTLQIRWALTYWPSLRASVAEVIGLGGVDHGAAQAGATCAVGFCRVATWQMRPGSALLEVLGGAAPPGVPYTSIYSETDGTAVAPTSVVDGATSIAVQAVCPERQVSHAALVSDAVTFALVVSALGSSAPIDATRVDRAMCALDRLGNITADFANSQDARGTSYFLGSYLDGAQVWSEPVLPAYAKVTSMSSPAP
jgi:triacylglycerol lipase